MIPQFYREMKMNSNFTQEITTQLIDKEVTQQAFMLATNDVAWLSCWLCLSLIPLLFLCKKVKPTLTVPHVVAH